MTEFVRGNLDRYVAELTEFASIPSVSSQARGIQAAADWVIAALRRRGVEATLHPTNGNPVVVGSTGSGARTVLLYNHYDVQPAEPLDAWTSPPFEPALRDGKLFARGVIDDKGEIVARLAALDLLRERHGDALPLRLTFFIEGEEENGSTNLEPFIAANQDLLAADACIWEAGTIDDEGRPQIWLGVRGLLSVELVAKTLAHDAHSGWAHALPNAAWRLHAALATLRDADENVAIDGFNDDMRGPTPRQRELLTAMPDELPTYRRQYGISRTPGNREGLELREALFAPTCNIAGLWSGHIGAGRKTVIPSTAHAVIDFRLVPTRSAALRRRLAQALGRARFQRHRDRHARGRPARRVQRSGPSVRPHDDRDAARCGTSRWSRRSWVERGRPQHVVNYLGSRLRPSAAAIPAAASTLPTRISVSTTSSAARPRSRKCSSVTRNHRVAF